jgi:hypothetical protein
MFPTRESSTLSIATRLVRDESKPATTATPKSPHLLGQQTSHTIQDDRMTEIMPSKNDLIWDVRDISMCLKADEGIKLFLVCTHEKTHTTTKLRYVHIHPGFLRKMFARQHSHCATPDLRASLRAALYNPHTPEYELSRVRKTHPGNGKKHDVSYARPLDWHTDAGLWVWRVNNDRHTHSATLCTRFRCTSSLNMNPSKSFEVANTITFHRPESHTLSRSSAAAARSCEYIGQSGQPLQAFAGTKTNTQMYPCTTDNYTSPHAAARGQSHSQPTFQSCAPKK